MSWNAALAVGLSYLAALFYFPVRTARPPVRVAAFGALLAVIGTSPLAVTDAPFLRLLAAIVAVAFSVKLYDLAVDPASAGALSGWRYATWFWNFAALVLREAGKLVRPAWRSDAARLVVGALLLVAGGALLSLVMRTNWTFASFATEHVVKVTALFAMLIPGGVAYSAAWRLAGHPALEMMIHPYLSRTPAEFWRRYNLPAQQFFYERVFKPSGGRRHPIRGTLLTFTVSALIHEVLFAVVLLRVEGYQSAFFLLQGLVVAATLGIKPRGAWAAVALLATMAFMYTSGVLFFASFDSVLDVYDNPLPWVTRSPLDRG
jgi:hypothetical protein